MTEQPTVNVRAQIRNLLEKVRWETGSKIARGHADARADSYLDAYIDALMRFLENLPVGTPMGAKIISERLPTVIMSDGPEELIIDITVRGDSKEYYFKADIMKDIPTVYQIQSKEEPNNDK